MKSMKSQLINLLIYESSQLIVIQARLIKKEEYLTHNKES